MMTKKKNIPAMPKYIIVGAQKAGTTSLFQAFCRHPKLVPPKHKELHFFDDLEIPYPDWKSYGQCFPSENILRGRQTFEASPSYLFHPLAATRMAALESCPHIIVILRNPIDRAYSAWNMYRQMIASQDPWKKSLGDSRDFDTALNEYLEGDHTMSWYRDLIDYFGRGLYAKQLIPYIKHFKLGLNLHVFFFEELFAGGFESILFEQIGLEGDFGISFEKVHVRKKNQPMSIEARSRLQQFYAKPNAELEGILGRPVPWH
jgi:hypothetical protein